MKESDIVYWGQDDGSGYKEFIGTSVMEDGVNIFQVQGKGSYYNLYKTNILLGVG